MTVSTCTREPRTAWPNAAITAASVLPSPVAISATRPSSIAIAPSSCTSNARSPSARRPGLATERADLDDLLGGQCDGGRGDRSRREADRGIDDVSFEIGFNLGVVIDIGVRIGVFVRFIRGGRVPRQKGYRERRQLGIGEVEKLHLTLVDVVEQGLERRQTDGGSGPLHELPE